MPTGKSAPASAATGRSCGVMRNAPAGLPSSTMFSFAGVSWQQQHRQRQRRALRESHTHARAPSDGNDQLCTHRLLLHEAKEDGHVRATRQAGRREAARMCVQRLRHALLNAVQLHEADGRASARLDAHDHQPVAVRRRGVVDDLRTNEVLVAVEHLHRRGITCTRTHRHRHGSLPGTRARAPLLRRRRTHRRWTSGRPPCP
jgi:hypothetical protein